MQYIVAAQFTGMKGNSWLEHKHGIQHGAANRSPRLGRRCTAARFSACACVHTSIQHVYAPTSACVHTNYTMGADAPGRELRNTGNKQKGYPERRNREAMRERQHGLQVSMNASMQRRQTAIDTYSRRRPTWKDIPCRRRVLSALRSRHHLGAAEKVSSESAGGHWPRWCISL